MKMIVAVDQGNAIGWQDGRLPWKLPEDMKRFKSLTTGGTVVMGFNTFKSLGRPNGLPNRRNIVLTRKNPLETQGLFGDQIEVVSSLNWVAQRCDDSTWIIGGASVYAEALEKNLVHDIYLTQVHTSSGADVTLPVDLFALVTYGKLLIRGTEKSGEWVVSKEGQYEATETSPAYAFLRLILQAETPT